MTYHADQLDPDQRQLAAVAHARRRAPVSLGVLVDDGRGQRVVAEDRHRRWLLGHQLEELRVVQVHALREPDAGPTPTTSRRRVPTLTTGTRLDVDEPRHPRARSTCRRPWPGRTRYNAFIQPLIDRYGYTSNGVKTGGGTVGYASTLTDADDFFRDAFQVAYNITLGGAFRHDVHAGLQWSKDAEDLNRASNGWGSINVPGGRLASIGLPGQPAYYYARRILSQLDGIEARHPGRVRGG